MFVFLFILVGYLAGFTLSVPVLLHRRMLGLVCGDKKYADAYYRKVIGVCEKPEGWHAGSGHKFTDPRPRGAVRDRNGNDVAVAIGLATMWLLIFLGQAIAYSARLMARRVARLAMSVTPLTEPERERRSRELEASLTKLQAEVLSTDVVVRKPTPVTRPPQRGLPPSFWVDKNYPFDF